MPDNAFQSGCDVITGELRQAWSALDRARKAVYTQLTIWNDTGCPAHHGASEAIRKDLNAICRSVEQIEVEVRQMATPVKPSMV